MKNGTSDTRLIWFEELRRTDVAKVGGKNASLGEMVQELGQKGIRVPPPGSRPPPTHIANSSPRTISARA